ncbi:MAG: hypothetical protein DWQ40_11930 [Actinobacteria bacterium]|nr:MAG: hypothetical protein DWQ40_11930 [Actinomycetota bacterium]REK35747.1 MAG: hypothetical protein DWQ20_05850 [Actinomycetota bacterium]
MDQIDLPKILGSALAGAIGFGVGYYAAFFVVLSIWGLDFDVSWFPVVGGVVASLGAGLGIALTVRQGRKAAAVVAALVLGAVLVTVVMALNADFGFMAVGGLVLAVLTALVIRTGLSDGFTGVTS